MPGSQCALPLGARTGAFFLITLATIACIAHPTTGHASHDDIASATPNLSDEGIPYQESDRVFEGVEKKLVMDVSFSSPPAGGAKRHSLRDISRTTWSSLLEHAHCSIVSVTSNKDFDAYVLSESSMFVYPTKVIMKTCGTTTLISAVTPFMLLVSSLNGHLRSVSFSRTNYEFPAAQDFPHESFEQEVTVLDDIFKGKPYVLGEFYGPRYHLYLAEAQESIDAEPEKTLELQLYGLDRNVMKHFYKENESQTGHDQTLNSGIDTLIPGSQIDDLAFEPCGYSMNGLIGKSYWTIHITPEANFSFVSFETNAPYPSYDDLIHRVVELFKPTTFSAAITIKGLALSDPDLQDQSQAFKGIFPHREFGRQQSNILNVGEQRQVSYSVHQSVKASTEPPKSIVKAKHGIATEDPVGIPACASSKCSGPPLVDSIEH